MQRDLTIAINRGKEITHFGVPEERTTLLNALYYIKEHIDNSLTFSSNCRSGVCGACAVRVNGKEVLACSYKFEEDDLVEPLEYHEVQRDLKVDKRRVKERLRTSTAWLQSYQEATISEKIFN